MEKLMKTSKTVDTILKVLYKIMQVSGIIILVGIGICVIAELTGLLPVSEISAITISDVTMEFKEPVTVSSSFATIEMATVMGMALIVICIMMYLFRVLRRILAPMIVGKPFDGTVSGNIKKLGIALITGGLVLDIVKAIGSNIAFYLYDIAKLCLSDSVSKITVNNQISMTNVLIGVLVILLSYVFRYGEELQQQADETL